jgi:rubredoxin---NAD+ reductase
MDRVAAVGAAAPVVVLGSGLAAWSVVRELRRLDRHMPVTLITERNGDFYAKPALSNALAQGKAAGQLVTTPANVMAQQLGVQLVAHTRISAVHTDQRTVQAPDGRAWPYAKLVLATGAQPIALALPESPVPVHTVNGLEDYVALRVQLDAVQRRTGLPARVLIVGAGLIGCEFANDLAARGHPVTVVDPGQRPLAGLLPAQASQQMADALAGLGVQWRWGQTASVELAAQHDLVLSAIGLRPDVTLAHASGLQTDRGVLVNDRLQTSAPDIYALGDVAQYSSASLGGTMSRPMPYVMPIMAAAKVLAAQLASGDNGANPARLHFAPMPIAVKTPACALLVLPPAPGASGAWQAPLEPGVWHWLDTQGAVQGFALAGAATARRATALAALEQPGGRATVAA